MDIQRELLSKMIQKSDVADVVDRKIGGHMFPDADSRKVFDGIMKFYGEYKAVPTLEWVEHEFPDYQLVFAKQPVRYYIDQLIKLYSASEGQKILLKHAPNIFRDPLATLDSVRADIARVAVEATPTEDLQVLESGDMFVEEYEYMKTLGGIDGYATPWNTLNDATWGIHKGEFWVIAARPAVGKTFDVLVLAEHLYREEGLKPLIISNEMGGKQLMRRFNAINFKLPYGNFRGGLLTMAEEKRLKDGLKARKERGLPIHVVQGQGLGMSAIAQKIDQYKPDILIVDGFYLTPDEQKGKDIYTRTTNVSRGFKQLALHYDIPVIGTTQFNRGVSEKSEEAELGNIGFADAIGQDADVVIGLIRTTDMKLNKEMKKQVMKCREGDTPAFRHMFDLDQMVFRDLNEVIREKFESEEDEGLNY